MNSKFAKISSRENISNSLFAKFSSRENKVLYSMWLYQCVGHIHQAAHLCGIEILLAPVFLCKRALAYFTREFPILPDCRVKWDSEPGKTGRKFRHIATSTIISN